MQDKPKTCRWCYWWDVGPDKEKFNEDKLREAITVGRECHASLPHFRQNDTSGIGGWPRTQGYEWCAHYKPFIQTIGPDDNEHHELAPIKYYPRS